MVHVALCKAMCENHAFGDRHFTWETVRSELGRKTPVEEPAPLIAALDRAQVRLRQALLRLTDTDLDTMVYTNWGDRWPAWRIFNSMIQHDIWHGGQIRTVRKPYTLAGQRPASG